MNTNASPSTPPAGDSWFRLFCSALFDRKGNDVELIGFGNPIKNDDSVGLYITKKLRVLYGSRPGKGILIQRCVVRPERLLTAAIASGKRAIIFDAVECNKPPGSIICSRLTDSRYGYFATHNVPLKLIAGLEEKSDGCWVVGIQPGNVEIGEDLSPIVKSSADSIISAFSKALKEGFD